MINCAEITGIILCGGQARRMDGVEKSLQMLNGRPLVAHVRERLRSQVSAIVISANRNHEAYAQWGDVVIADRHPDHGPLGGLLTSLGAIRTPWFFCCPGDAPFLMRDLVTRLARRLEASASHSLAYPYDGEHAQHLFLLGRATQATALNRYLADGARSVGRFVTEQQALRIDMSAYAGQFRNINTARELEEAAAHGTSADFLRAGINPS